MRLTWKSKRYSAAEEKKQAFIEEKKKLKEMCTWHKHFAVLPVSFSKNPKEIETYAFLEYVERRAKDGNERSVAIPHDDHIYFLNEPEWEYRCPQEGLVDTLRGKPNDLENEIDKFKKRR